MERKPKVNYKYDVGRAVWIERWNSKSLRTMRRAVKLWKKANPGDKLLWGGMFWRVVEEAD